MRVFLAAILLLQDRTPDQLLEDLGSDKIEERGRAREQFKKLGSAAVPALERAAEGTDPHLSQEARALLDQILFRGNYARQQVERLRSEDAGDVESAKRDLTRAGPAAVPILILGLADADPSFREACLGLLADLKSEAGIEPAWKILDSEQPRTLRKEAFRLLTGLGKKSEDLFLRGLTTSSARVKAASIDGLGVIASEKAILPVSTLFLSEFDSTVRPAATRFMRRQRLRVEDTLLQGLKSAALTVRVSSVELLGQARSEKAYDRVRALYSADQNWDLHRSCLEFFKCFGLKAERELLLATSDENVEVRRDAVLALGDVRSPAAIPRLIELLADNDPELHEASKIALASIGASGKGPLESAVQEKRIQEKDAQTIEALRSDFEVERALESRIGRVGSAGAEGEFKDLESLGRPTVLPVLIRMLNAPDYKFVLAYRHSKAYWYREVLQELAVSALGSLGGEGAREAVAAFAVGAQQNEQLRLQDAVALAQSRLGDRKPLEDRLVNLRQSGEDLQKGENPSGRIEGCLKLSSLCMLLDRLGRREEAARTSKELMDFLDRETGSGDLAGGLGPAGDYNVACFYAIGGSRSQAVRHLEKAVRGGFLDRRWIEADEDLDSIRGEEGYRQLISNDALFEKTGFDE